MARKQEIKVYLPERLVGELEGRKRLGTRSKFIEMACNLALRNKKTSALTICTLVQILCVARDKLREQNDIAFSEIIQSIINEVNK